MNARSTKTRKLLQEGLVKAMLEKNHHDINVSDIVKQAGLNRTTFYCHYNNIDELYKEITNELDKKALESITSKELGIEEFLKYVKANKNTYKALLLNPNDGMYINEFSKHIIKEAIHYTGTSKNKELLYSYSLHGSIGLVKKWIETDFKMSEKKLANILKTIADKIDEI